MRLPIILALAAAASIAGCTFVNQAPPTRTPQTQLQTREYQTREFDTNDVKLVMKAVLNVLQDDGFVVRNAVTDLGLLTASKEYNINSVPTRTGANNDSWLDLLDIMFGRNGNRTRQQPDRDREVRTASFKSIEVSVNVSEMGKRCKVRANFQAKILDNNGNPMSVQPVEDPKFYQDFFVKVDKGIFLQKQGF